MIHIIKTSPFSKIKLFILIVLLFLYCDSSRIQDETPTPPIFIEEIEKYEELGWKEKCDLYLSYATVYYVNHQDYILNDIYERVEKIYLEEYDDNPNNITLLSEMGIFYLYYIKDPATGLLYLEKGLEHTSGTEHQSLFENLLIQGYLYYKKYDPYLELSKMVYNRDYSNYNDRVSDYFVHFARRNQLNNEAPLSYFQTAHRLSYIDDSFEFQSLTPPPIIHNLSRFLKTWISLYALEHDNWMLSMVSEAQIMVKWDRTFSDPKDYFSTVQNHYDAIKSSNPLLSQDDQVYYSLNIDSKPILFTPSFPVNQYRSINHLMEYLPGMMEYLGKSGITLIIYIRPYGSNGKVQDTLNFILSLKGRQTRQGFEVRELFYNLSFLPYHIIENIEKGLQEAENYIRVQHEDQNLEHSVIINDHNRRLCFIQQLYHVYPFPLSYQELDNKVIIEDEMDVHKLSILYAYCRYIKRMHLFEVHAPEIKDFAKRYKEFIRMYPEYFQ